MTEWKTVREIWCSFWDHPIKFFTSENSTCDLVLVYGFSSFNESEQTDCTDCS